MCLRCRQNEIAAVDEMFNENTEPVEENLSEISTVSGNDEVALKSYSQAFLDPERRKSTMSKIKALWNSEYWCVVQKPNLICSGSIMSCIQWLSKSNI